MSYKNTQVSEAELAADAKQRILRRIRPAPAQDAALYEDADTGERRLVTSTAQRLYGERVAYELAGDLRTLDDNTGLG